MRVALLVAAAVLSGCASAPQGLSSLTQPAPQQPFYKEFHEAITPGFSKTYNVSVAPGAKLLNATLVLSTQTHGLPAPGVVPATADISLGALSARADPSNPSVKLELPEPVAGKYRINVNATGPSGNVEGTGDYGASFVLVLQVAYGQDS